MPWTDVEIIAQIVQAIGEGPDGIDRCSLMARPATERRSRRARSLMPLIPPHR